MNENRSKRREWVKTAAIIFLSVMLVLTFFSQTILNHSLPEVATKYVQSGSITSKIRGSGVVESGDPYTIEVPGIYVGRKVSSISVKVGDKVEKGDVLFYLLEGDGAELEAAKEALKMAQSALETAQDAYDDYILSANITSSDINSANANVSTETLRQRLTNLQTTLKQSKEKAEPLQTAVNQLNQAIADCTAQIEYESALDARAGERFRKAETALNQAQAAYDSASEAVTDAGKALTGAESDVADAEKAVTDAKSELDALKDAVSKGDIPEEEAESQISAANAKVADAEKNLADAKQRKETAEKALEEKRTAFNSANTVWQNAAKEMSEAQKARDQREASAVINNLQKQIDEYTISLYNYNKNLNAVNDEIQKTENEINELIGNSGVIKAIQSLQDAIDTARKDLAEKQKKVDDLQAEVGGSAITADISGTVTAINVTSGKTIQGQDVMILQPEGQGFFMTFSVTNDQAKTLSIGDKASLVNSWYYNDLDIILQSIKPDKSDPSQRKMLTFTVNGDATVGQNLSVSVGQKSQNYDLIVPNSAIKEDNNGKFILIVQSKSSPVGNRYIATRVDVQVLASDDTQSAISGAISGWEYVITTSSKPINPGDQVRMTDN